MSRGGSSEDVFIMEAQREEERERRGREDMRIQLIESAECCSGESVKEAKEMWVPSLPLGTTGVGRP